MSWFSNFKSNYSFSNYLVPILWNRNGYALQKQKTFLLFQVDCHCWNWITREIWLLQYRLCNKLKDEFHFYLNVFHIAIWENSTLESIFGIYLWSSGLSHVCFSQFVRFVWFVNTVLSILSVSFDSAAIRTRCMHVHVVSIICMFDALCIYLYYTWPCYD